MPDVALPRPAARPAVPPDFIPGCARPSQWHLLLALLGIVLAVTALAAPDGLGLPLGGAAAFALLLYQNLDAASYIIRYEVEAAERQRVAFDLPVTPTDRAKIREVVRSACVPAHIQASSWAYGIGLAGALVLTLLRLL